MYSTYPPLPNEGKNGLGHPLHLHMPSSPRVCHPDADDPDIRASALIWISRASHPPLYRLRVPRSGSDDTYVTKANVNTFDSHTEEPPSHKTQIHLPAPPRTPGAPPRSRVARVAPWSPSRPARPSTRRSPLATPARHPCSVGALLTTSTLIRNVVLALALAGAPRPSHAGGPRSFA